MGKTILDFEKPVFELEQKLEEMKKSSNRLGIDKEINRIEAKVSQLKEVPNSKKNYTKISHAGSEFS